MSRAIAGAAAWSIGLLLCTDAWAQTTGAPEKPGFACDATRLGDLPRDVAEAVARDACAALSALTGGRGSFTVDGQRDGERYALLLRRREGGDSALVLVDVPPEVRRRVSEGAASWARRTAGVVPERERQLTFSVVWLVPHGLPRASMGWGGGLGYRLATPRWALGAVAEITGATAGGSDGAASGHLYGSLAFSARRFLTAADSSAFVGGGAGLLGLVEAWSTNADTGCAAICLDPIGGDAARSLGTFAPFFEGGFVLGRGSAAQVALSLRADVPLTKLGAWSGAGPAGTVSSARETYPAVYVLPLSFRLGIQL